MRQRDKIIEILTIIFTDFDGEINESLAKTDVEEWNSLASAQIIMAMEKEFNKHFTDREIASINTVGDIIRLVGGE